MVDPRTKGEDLSETTKSYLREVFIEEVYGRKKPDIDTKYTKKGTIVETDSIALVEQVFGDTHFKNNKFFENEFICGTPDIVTATDLLIDIKSSFDIWTFAGTTEKKATADYYYQILGYMWLTGKRSAELIYALVNTPEEIIQGELYRLQFSIPELALGNKEVEEDLRKNYIFDDIDPKERIKKYSFVYSADEIAKVQLRVEKSREYLQKITL